MRAYNERIDGFTKQIREMFFSLYLQGGKDAETKNADLAAYANEHGFVLFDERMAEKALMAIRKEKENGWIPIADDKLPEFYERVLITVNGCRGLIVREARFLKSKNEFEVLHNHERWEVGEKGLLAWRPLPEPYMEGDAE